MLLVGGDLDARDQLVERVVEMRTAFGDHSALILNDRGWPSEARGGVAADFDRLVRVIDGSALGLVLGATAGALADVETVHQVGGERVYVFGLAEARVDLPDVARP